MVGEVVAGRYELQENIGVGGMASVYKAHDRLLERNVALKILDERYVDDEEYVERFRREARAAAQLSHPNIVTVIDRGSDDSRQYIVFEYVEGETLKDLINRSGPLPVRHALELALQVARGLAFAHQFGLVHRDVKPQNVLLNGDGQAKVTDFGIARSLDVEHGVTQTGTVLGTSNYIAPEQASGERVDQQSDIYSLGVVVYELLTGEVPFTGDNFVAVAMKHMSEPPPPVRDRRPDVPARLAAAIDRTLAKDPADRFQTMAELEAELEACLEELDSEGDATMIVERPVAAARPTARPARRARRRRWPVLAVLALCAVLAAAAAAALMLTAREDEGSRAAGPREPVELRGVASYDPQGDDRTEHPEAVARAADGDPDSYWPTSTYYGGFTKDGVGVVLDAGAAASPRQVIVRSTTPGFTARIDAGEAPGGPFRPVSSVQEVGTSTTFQLRDVEARYFVVWITSLPGGVAHINEVVAR